MAKTCVFVCVCVFKWYFVCKWCVCKWCVCIYVHVREGERANKYAV